jgi:hypothetical protein
MGVALVRNECFKNQILCISASDVLTTRVIIDLRYEWSILLDVLIFKLLPRLLLIDR